MGKRFATANAARSFVSSAIFCASITSPGTRYPLGTKHHPISGRPWRGGLRKCHLGSPVQEICTLGSAWGDEFKKPRSLGEGTGAKASDNSEAPQRATASRLVSTILRI